MRVDTSTKVERRDFDRRLVGWILKAAGNPRVSVRLWNGDEFQVNAANPVACMEFRDRRAVFELLVAPRTGFGDCYSKGLIDIQGDFLAFAEEVTRSITKSREGSYYLPRLHSFLHSLRPNTLTRSRNNVHHHYDLGNDFYALWLDPRMVYTCAYFESPDATLEQAQIAKLDHVCRKLDLRPGQKVIEAGCGWGALAIHMAQNYGVDVIAYNNSHEQVAFARARAEALGLGDRVRFVEADYRTMNERCDVFVSIGMLEHVGRASYRTLGDLIRRWLKPEGFALLHTIGRSHPQPPDKWILKRVFPGGHIPSLAEMSAVFEPHQFSVLDVENLRPHYARTCALWLENFEAAADRVAAMYSDEFVRTWRLYLAGSSAGFSTGTLQLYQVLFTPPGNARVPWTRRYQYPA